MEKKLFEDNQSGAKFSDDRKHRFALWRIWDQSLPYVMFIGLNPSKADETKADNTITKVVKIAKNNGYGGIYMTNLFSYVSTDPSKLILPEASDNTLNNTYLKSISEVCDKIIFAWGNFKQARERASEVIEMFSDKGYALHINNNGSPKHPLYCLDATIPVPFPI